MTGLKAARADGTPPTPPPRARKKVWRDSPRKRANAPAQRNEARARGDGRRWHRPKLLRISALQADLYRRLALYSPIFIDHLAISLAGAPDKQTWFVATVMSGGGASFTIQLDQPMLRYLLGDLAQPDALPGSPPDLRLAIMARTLDPILNILEAQFETSLSLLEVATQPVAAATNAIAFDVFDTAADSAAGRFRVAGNRTTWQRLSSLLPTLSPVRKRHYPALTAPLIVGLPGMRLSPDEIRSLRRGDVLRPGVSPDRAVLPLHLGRHRLGEAVINGNNYRIRRIDMASEEDDEDDFGNDEVEPGVDAGTVELEVTFDIGRVQLSVDEIAALQPGYVFDLPGSSANNVVVRANGTPIGRGELVAIGDELGIRLLETPDGDHRSGQ